MIQSKQMLGGCLMVALLALGACRKADSSGQLPKTDKAAASQVESAFQDSADARARQNSAALAEAFRQRNYEGAYQALNNLQATKAENLNQVMAVESAHRRLQADILRGVEVGDPKAVQLWAQMKSRRRD